MAAPILIGAYAQPTVDPFTNKPATNLGFRLIAGNKYQQQISMDRGATWPVVIPWAPTVDHTISMGLDPDSNVAYRVVLVQ